MKKTHRKYLFALFVFYIILDSSLSYSNEVTLDIYNPSSPLYIENWEAPEPGLFKPLLDYLKPSFDKFTFELTANSNLSIDLINRKKNLINRFLDLKKNVIYDSTGMLSSAPILFNYSYLNNKLILLLWGKGPNKLDFFSNYGLYILSENASIFLTSDDFKDPSKTMRDILNGKNLTPIITSINEVETDPMLYTFTFINKRMNVSSRNTNYIVDNEKDKILEKSIVLNKSTMVEEEESIQILEKYFLLFENLIETER